MLLCRTGPFTHKAGKPARAGIVFRSFVRFIGAQDAARFCFVTLSLAYPVMQKSSYARTHFTGRQVSPAFARSLSADGLRTGFGRRVALALVGVITIAVRNIIFCNSERQRRILIERYWRRTGMRATCQYFTPRPCWCP